MKHIKTAWSLLGIGIMLLLTGIMLLLSLAQETKNINGLFSTEKITVSLKENSSANQSCRLSLDDIEQMKKLLHLKSLAYTAQSSSLDVNVRYESINTKAKVIGTNSDYQNFAELCIKNGSYFSEKDEKEKRLVAVIDERLAWLIFKTNDVIGNAIYIYNQPFKIVGVAGKNPSPISRMTGSDKPAAYIPSDRMLELDNTSFINSLELHTGLSKHGLDEQAVAHAIDSIGKDSAYFGIKDFNSRFLMLKQKPLMLIFLIGAVSILILIKYIIKNLVWCKDMVKKSLEDYYFWDAVKINIKNFMKLLLPSLLAAVLAAGIWECIRFALFVPTKLIPDELNNLQYYNGLLRGFLQASFSNQDYIFSQTEVLTRTVDIISTWILLIAALLGFYLVHKGFSLADINGENILGILTAAGVFIIVLIFLIVWVQAALMLPCIMDIKALLVIWGFLYINFIAKIKNERVV